jgi:hypothetical protein
MGSISLQVVAAAPDELPQLQQALAAHTREKALESPIGRLILGMGRRARP